jgi:carbon storage regulator
VALVISRFKNQRFVIGQNIVIEIISVDRGKVKMCITAPPDIEINREELFRAKFPDVPLPLPHLEYEEHKEAGGA